MSERLLNKTIQNYRASLKGDGAIAQGDGAMAVGKGGVLINNKGDFTGNITVGNNNKINSK